MLYYEFIIVFSVAMLSAFFGVFLIGPRMGTRQTTDIDSHSSEVCFLYKNDDLQHASELAKSVVGLAETDTDWKSLHTQLHKRFQLMPVSTTEISTTPVIVNATDASDKGFVRLTRSGETVHVEIVEPGTSSPTQIHQIKSLEAELATLRMASSTSSHPMWQTNDSGDVQWYNSAYASLYQRIFGEGPDSKQPLFETFAMVRQPSGRTRASLQQNNDGDRLWFDVNTVQSGTKTMFHAMDINAVIQAEVAQRNFVQTLAKTFAQLSIGLAIFDRNGQLALFNPALVDLTGLQAEFLSARPDLLSFFDRLRDNRVMPEPKNYHSWRQEIADVIAAATDGRYQETWSLDTGHTYRVSGRPHPDGAIAFLIEDISAEVSMTRNYRAELEMSQSLMDSLNDGLVVFSSAGILQFCNAAYREMWKLDPESSFAEVTIIDSLRDWQKQSHPDPAWGDVRDFVFKVGERAPWDSIVERDDENRLICSVSPIASGATLIRFEKIEDAIQLHPNRLSVIQD